MRDVSCKLLSTTFEKNSIGVMISKVKEIEIPIIKIEDIYANEFYEANEQGFKPTLRLRISKLNYEWNTFKDKTILIAGARGLIGSFFVDEIMFLNKIKLYE